MDDIAAGLQAVEALRAQTNAAAIRDGVCNILGGTANTEGIIQKIEMLGRWIKHTWDVIADA